MLQFKACRFLYFTGQICVSVIDHDCFKNYKSCGKQTTRALPFSIDLFPFPTLKKANTSPIYTDTRTQMSAHPSYKLYARRCCYCCHRFFILFSLDATDTRADVDRHKLHIKKYCTNKQKYICWTNTYRLRNSLKSIPIQSK